MDALSVTTKPHSQMGGYNNTRKSLFQFSRDVFSMKQNVPLSRLRDFLSGSGKNSENSTHFNRKLTQYFRPDNLEASKRQSKMRTASHADGASRNLAKQIPVSSPMNRSAIVEIRPTCDTNLVSSSQHQQPSGVLTPQVVKTGKQNQWTSSNWDQNQLSDSKTILITNPNHVV